MTRLATMLVALTALAGARAQAANVTIKLGTLAPDGSGWHLLLKEQAAQWDKLSGGRVKLKIYAGGVAGNESDMVRKMRIGQLQAAAVTVIGLGDIDAAAKSICAPGFAQSDEEYQHLAQKMQPEWEKRLEQKGFVVLTWGDMGWARMFVTREARTPAQLAGLKIFTWSGDPGSAESWRALGFQPIIISATDMMSSLATGMIESFANTPIMAMTARWFEHAKFMPDMPFGRLAGATIVTKEAWEKVPADLRPVLLASGRESGRRVDAEVDRMTRDALDAMKKAGLRVIALSDAERAQWAQAADRIYPILRGTAFPADVADAARALRDEFRASKKAK